MSFTSTGFDFSKGIENYPDALYTSHLVPIIGTIVGLYFLASIFICRKQKVEVSVWFLAFGGFTTVVLYWYIMSTNLPWELHYFELSVRRAWTFRNDLVTNLTTINNGIISELGNTLTCIGGLASCSENQKMLLKSPIDDVLDTLSSMPSLTTVESLTKNYALAIDYITILHNFILCNIILYVIAVISVYFLEAVKTHRRYFHAIAISWSFIILVFGICFFVGATVLSDVCVDFQNTVESFLDDENLKFYMTCNPNLIYIPNAPDNELYPPFLINADDGKLLKILKNENSAEVGIICNDIPIFYSLAHRFKSSHGYIVNMSTNCCGGCNKTNMHEVATILGDYKNKTGLWGSIACQQPNILINNAEDNLCDLFMPLFGLFITFVTLVPKILSLFYFLPKSVPVSDFKV